MRGILFPVAATPGRAAGRVPSPAAGRSPASAGGAPAREYELWLMR